MQLKTIFGRVPAAAAVAAAAVGAIATTMTSASAAPTAAGQLCNPNCYASASFNPDGETFTVHDNKADGHSAIGYLYTWSGGAWHLHGSVLNSNGANGSAVTANYSIAEGTDVTFDVCLYEKSSGPFSCSDFYTTKA